MTAKDSRTAKTVAAGSSQLTVEQLTGVSGGYVLPPRDVEGERKGSAPGGRLPVGSVRAKKT